METNKTNIFEHIALFAMGILMVLSAVLVFPYILSRAHAASAPVASESTLTVDTADIVVDAKVNPDGTSTFFKATSNLTISTNNYSGYTLRIVAEDEDTHDRLINTLAGSYLESITEATSEQDFKDGASFLGKFGYSPSKLASSENTDFLPAPDTTGDVLDVTSAANSGEGEENTYSISLGTKVDITIPSGEYVNTYIYEVVANPVPYLIAFDENTTDTVTNMPSTQQDDATADGIELDDTTPERAHYDFLGWCEGTTTNTVTEQDDIYTCDGTVYQPGDTFYLDQTTDNQVELKAMWEIHKNRLDINGHLDGSNSTGIEGYGTVDVYINGNQVADDTTDYAVYWKYGTTYEVNDIKTNTGKQYDGVYSDFPLVGTIEEEYVDLRLTFSTKTYSVQLVTTNGTGATTKTIMHGSTASFTGVGPNTGYNDTNTISCTNSQTATKSGSTVTTGEITDNTVCTVSFPIKTFSVQLVTTNGTGATTKTVNYGANAQFTNVKPNTNYNDTNTISCTNSQTASKSSTTVTTGAITNNTVCTISFPIKTYTVQLVTTNGSGATTKTVNHGATAQFTNVKPNSNYKDTNSISCTNSQTASKSGTTVTTGAITNNTVCTISFPIKTYSVQLVTTNGSGGTTKTVNHGATAQFTNVKPNSNYNDTNSISCTNSQTASKSGTTVTTGAITNNTVCTISFPIKTYSVKLTVSGGSGSTTKTVNHGSSTSFSVSASAGYSYKSLSCTASQTASISGNTVTTGAITAATTCTLTYTDQTRPSAPSIVYGIHSLRVQASNTITFKIIVKSSDSSGSNISYYIHDKTSGTSFGYNTCANNTNCTLTADTGLTASAKDTWHNYEICATDASNNLICSALIGSWTAQRFYIHQLYGGFRAIWGNTYNVDGSEITLHLDALSSKNTAHMIKGMYGQTEPTNFYNGLNTTQKCENLYHAILGRASDSGGLTNCINNINGGRTFQSIATEMANSAEGQAIYSTLGFPTGTTPLP